SAGASSRSSSTRYRRSSPTRCVPTPDARSPCTTSRPRRRPCRSPWRASPTAPCSPTCCARPRPRSARAVASTSISSPTATAGCGCCAPETTASADGHSWRGWSRDPAAGETPPAVWSFPPPAGARSADELLRENVRCEAREVVDALALPHELHRDAGLLLHGEHEAALGGAVELGEHEARDARVLDERVGLGEPVLAGRRVEHEQHLRDGLELLDDAAHLAELVHETRLGLQSARGVDEHDLDTLALREFDGLEGDGCRILSRLLRPHDARAGPLGPGRELFDGRGAEGVG